MHAEETADVITTRYMKLSKIILEDKTIVARTEVDMSNDDINKHLRRT